MKTNKIMLLVTGLTVASSLVMNASAEGSAQQITSYQHYFSTVSRAEVPVQVAKLVRQASPAEQEKVSLAVLRAAVSANPSATAQIVASISKAAPQLAKTVAAAAIELQPKQASQILRAAKVSNVESTQVALNVSALPDMEVASSATTTAPKTIVATPSVISAQPTLASGNSPFVVRQASPEIHGNRRTSKPPTLVGGLDTVSASLGSSTPQTPP